MFKKRPQLEFLAKYDPMILDMISLISFSAYGCMSRGQAELTGLVFKGSGCDHEGLGKLEAKLQKNRHFFSNFGRVLGVLRF